LVAALNLSGVDILALAGDWCAVRIEILTLHREIRKRLLHA
jgi:hypothetical protein